MSEVEHRRQTDIRGWDSPAQPLGTWSMPPPMRIDLTVAASKWGIIRDLLQSHLNHVDAARFINALCLAAEVAFSTSETSVRRWRRDRRPFAVPRELVDELLAELTLGDHLLHRSSPELGKQALVDTAARFWKETEGALQSGPAALPVEGLEP